MPGKRVFVTGASGQLGLRIVKLLVAQGDTVVGLGRSEASCDKIRAAGAQAVLGSLTNPELIKQEASNVDACFHTAFNHDDFSRAEESCKEDRACLQACIDGLNSNTEGEKEKFLLYTTGTFGTSGPTEEDGKLEDPYNSRWKSDELVIKSASPTLRTVVTRLPPIVHERASVHAFISYMMVPAAEKDGAARYIDESIVWPSTHYDDVAQLCILALNRAPAGSSVFNAVAEEGISTKTIVEWVSKKTGKPLKQVSREQAMGMGFIGILLGMSNKTTSHKTRKVLGWSPQGASLLEDLAVHS